MQLSINFQADALVDPVMGDLYSKLFLLPDTMTLDKSQLYGYGITDLRSVLDNSVNEPTRVQRTIPPDQEYMFRVGMFSNRDSTRNPARKPPDYVLRSGLVLENDDPVYIIRANREPTRVAFGKITSEK